MEPCRYTVDCDACNTRPCESPHNPDKECWTHFESEDAQVAWLLLAAETELEAQKEASHS